MYTSDAPNLTPPDDAARSDGPIAQPSSLPPLAESLNWLSHFRRYSRLLVAVIEPTTLTLRYGNDHFYNVVGVSQQETGAATNLGDALPQLLSAASNQAIERLYRRHLVHRVFSQQYGVNLDQCRLLDEPLLLTLNSPLYPEPRCVEVWLRSDQLAISRLDSTIDEFGLGCQTPEMLECMLADPAQLEDMAQRLQLDNYRIDGWLLLEGLDVTEREIIRRITQLLIDRDSILQPQKFREVDQQMRSLFRAQNTVVLSIEADQTRLFMGTVDQELDSSVYSLDALQASHFLRAVETNQVLIVPDLAQNCQTIYGRKLLHLGVRSLLLIPLVSHIGSSDAPHTVGLVGVLSDRPNTFDGLDCRSAESLIPAFTAALLAAQRQLVQKRFIANIHPAVEWRFLEEAERRSLGLLAEAITFPDVYPLYGISDIRGSSEERNRAIQADLLEQFRLGLAIVEAAGAMYESALGKQLQLDLQEQMHHLQTQVTVDSEVTVVRYLQQHLESYFDYFVQCGDAAIAAVDAYRTACNNEHGSVYRARAQYDRTINQINTRLRQTWDQWQIRMQRISPHYCDIEATDGIDHMIYAGEAIDPKFGRFHLSSLRYEQLCALCDCARTAYRLQDEYQTTMQVTHLALVQDSTVDIFHDETTERLFEVRGSRDMRYEIVKKRIDKALDDQTKARITQPGMLTLVYSTEEEWAEYEAYFRYLAREGWVNTSIERGKVQPLQGVNGLKYARVRVLPQAEPRE